MQLKRDTDYAFRIVCCVSRLSEGEDGAHAVTLLTIIRQTGVARRNAKRVCDYLSDSDVLKKQDSGGVIAFSKGEAWKRASLLDVVSAVEGTADIFAVFDKKQQAFRDMEDRLGLVKEAVEEALKSVRLDEL